MINLAIFWIERAREFVAALDWWLWHRGFVR
jgi:hypothetical protein